MSTETSSSGTGSRQYLPFTGGQKLMAGAGIAGVVLTAVTFAGGVERAMPSYLVSFLYWVGISAAAIVWLSIHHAASAQWMTVLRRQVEHMASFVWLGALLFIPLYVFRHHIFVWTLFENGTETPADVAARFTDHFKHLMHDPHSGKAIWLSSSFFLVRAIVVFAFWGVISFLYNKWSIDQDTKAPDEASRSKARKLASGAMLFLGFAFTIGGIDWMMALEPEWASAMIGVSYFAGSFVACWAVLTLTTVMPMDPNLHSTKATHHHLHNLGKFMFAFTCFWAYISYSQLVIIYHANIPEEVPWYFARGIAGLSQFTADFVHPDPRAAKWFQLLMFLVIGHFILPFLLLLPSTWKRSRKFLTVVAMWILFAHFFDVYFWVMPSLRLLNEAYREPNPGWQDATAFFGIGGLAVAFVIFRMRGKLAMPVNDPGFEYSLKYVNPL